MREGQNPAKLGIKAYQVKQWGIALLSCIPSQEGYFTQALDILKYQIASIHATTKDFDLMVFDNGSCEKVQDDLRLLQSQGLIHFLLLSQYNLGKTGALNRILASMPHEYLVYSDGDVLFRPLWQEQTALIFEAFPQAGLVTAQPCLFDILRGGGQAHLHINDSQRYQWSTEQLSHEAVGEYLVGIGHNVENAQESKERTVQVIQDCQTGYRAVLGASHMQFTIPRELAHQVQPLPSTYALNREEDAFLNNRIDQFNRLHLSTIDPYIVHMGNHLTPKILEEIQEMGLERWLIHPPIQLKNRQSRVSPLKANVFRILNFLAKFYWIRRFLQRLYVVLFEFFAQGK